MSGATKNFDNTQKIVDSYLEKNDIYTSIKNPKFISEDMQLLSKRII